MIEVGLFDSTFHEDQPSATLDGENFGESPQHIKWVRENCLDITFYTDIRLDEASRCPRFSKKIAWLLEPNAFSSTAYKNVISSLNWFDFVLTHDAELLGKLGYKGLWCPVGGSWIKQMGIYKKDRMISMITTNKNKTEGHVMRHTVQKELAMLGQYIEVDLFGSGILPIESKAEALRNYQYSIVIESASTPFYFTEKLIDCLSQGTVAIYWGSPSYASYFHPGGIIPFRDLDELMFILNGICKGEDNYPAREHAIKTNVRLCKHYRCVEDWIYLHYPWLFE